MRNTIIFLDNKIREIHSSILLSVFLLFSFSYHFVSQQNKPIITMIILVISFVSMFYSRTDKLKVKFPYKSSIISVGFIIVTFLIEILNSSFSPGSFYIITTFTFAYFFKNGKFNRKIIYFPIIIISLFFTYYILSGQDLNNIFPHSSRNMISYIMITNASIVMIIEWRQYKKIVIWPSVLTLLFSLFAIGRSGIICSSFLLIGVLFIKYNSFSFIKKNIYLVYVVVPILLFIILGFDMIKQLYFLEKIINRGIVDEARYNMIHAYLLHMDFKNILIGYNIESSHVFIRNHLNTHNSYINLHYHVGFIFFIVLYYLIRTLFKLFFNNRLYFFILFSLLLRAGTDTILFHSQFDFLILFFILISRKNNNYDK